MTLSAAVKIGFLCVYVLHGSKVR